MRPPKSTWGPWLTNGSYVVVAATVVAAIVGFFPVHGRTAFVAEKEGMREQALVQNDFWQMVASGEGSSSSPYGELADALQEPLQATNPAQALLDTYVEPGVTPENISDELGLQVYTDTRGEEYRPSQNTSAPTSGYLSPTFILRAIQCTPANVDDVLVDTTGTMPKVGLPSWTSYIMLISAPLALFLVLSLLIFLFWLPVDQVKKAQARKKERAEFEALPDLAQDVVRIQQRLQSQYPANDPRVREVRRLAEETFKAVATEEQAAAAIDSGNDLDRLEVHLKTIGETSQVRTKVYEDLSKRK